MIQPTILVVEDEEAIRRACARLLGSEYRVLEAGTLEEAREKLRGGGIDVCLCDVRLPDGDALRDLTGLRRLSRDTEFVVMTGQGGVDEAVEAVKAGAYDFIPKPFDPADRVPITVAKALERRNLRHRAQELESEAARRDGFEAVLASAPAMRRAVETARQAATTSVGMLILGESGTGKEVLARAIHQSSLRNQGPFVVVNCGALPATLVESELFGHEKGSFTGAMKDKRGLFEEAHRGTILLDEIGEMPLPAQVALLRVLQSGEIRRVGASGSRNVDVRVLAATNVDLKSAVQEKKFREDLFYRLNVIPVELPPLRQRRDDIPSLALHFLRRSGKKLARGVNDISDPAMSALLAWGWPGNVRELENTIERGVVLARGTSLDLVDLPEAMTRPSQASPATALPGNAISAYKEARDRVMAEFEAGYIGALLQLTGGNMAAAAEKAGMERSNFRKLVVRSGVDFHEFLPGRARK